MSMPEKKNKRMSPYIPEDVLFKILLRANTKTLLRCTLVCKAWKSIIRNTEFVEAHLNQQKTTRDLLIVRACPDNAKLFSWHSDDMTFNEVGHSSSQNFPSDFNYRTLGSCNGVICLVDDYNETLEEDYDESEEEDHDESEEEDIFLWNPAIRVCVQLPPHHATFKPYSKIHSVTLFGADPVSNDYKVIRIIYHRTESREVELKALMYTLSSGTWKNISHLAAEFRLLQPNRLATQTYFNGASHWIVFGSEKNCATVLLFHMGDEVFRSFKVPADVSTTNENWDINGLKPAVFQGLFSVVERSVDGRCCLWTMEQYGVDSSWVKRYDIYLTHSFYRMLGFRKDGRFLVDVYGKLYCFDPKEKDRKKIIKKRQLKDLGIYCPTGRCIDSLEALEYVESLALLRT